MRKTGASFSSSVPESDPISEETRFCVRVVIIADERGKKGEGDIEIMNFGKFLVSAAYTSLSYILDAPSSSVVLPLAGKGLFVRGYPDDLTLGA